jgi:hypothetical protein
MWQIPARRSARVGEANGLNQPHSECRETKLTERKTGDQVGRASGFAPSSGSRRGYSCADPVLTELEFEVKPTNIRHTHIPPPSPFPSASSATTAALPLAFACRRSRILDEACIHTANKSLGLAPASLRTRAYVLKHSRASNQERGGHPNMTSPRAFASNTVETMAPSSSTTSSAVHSLTSASTLDSPTESSARRALRDSVFESATWREPDGETPEELQRKDPLGTQIWKLYSKTRNTLPNSERMENLTWRMMSMNLRRAQHQRYAPPLDKDPPTNKEMPLTSCNSRLAHAYQQRANAPSGIAQLRQSAEAQQSQSQSQSHFPIPNHDHMNLDDFIVPSSIASPISQPSPPASFDPSTTSLDSKATPTGIPIRRHQQLQDEAQDDFVARASAPSVAPTAINKATDEFGYIQRHVRKTSIDERRVIYTPTVSDTFRITNFLSSHPSDVPIARPKSLPSPLACTMMLSSTTTRSTRPLTIQT